MNILYTLLKGLTSLAQITLLSIQPSFFVYVLLLTSGQPLCKLLGIDNFEMENSEAWFYLSQGIYRCTGSK